MFPFFSLSLLSLLLSFCVGEMSFFSQSIGFEGGVESCDPLSRQGPIEGASNRLKGVFNAENNFPPVLILVPPPPCLWLHLSVNSLRLSGSPALRISVSPSLSALSSGLQSAGNSVITSRARTFQLFLLIIIIITISSSSSSFFFFFFSFFFLLLQLDTCNCSFSRRKIGLFRSSSLDYAEERQRVPQEFFPNFFFLSFLPSFLPFLPALISPFLSFWLGT